MFVPGTFFMDVLKARIQWQLNLLLFQIYFMYLFHAVLYKFGHSISIKTVLGVINHERVDCWTPVYAYCKINQNQQLNGNITNNCSPKRLPITTSLCYI